jgi:hypothetical protein
MKCSIQAANRVANRLTVFPAESYNGWRQREDCLPTEEHSMSIALSPEAQAKAAQISDIASRLERSINEQYALEL